MSSYLKKRYFVYCIALLLFHGELVFSAIDSNLSDGISSDMLDISQFLAEGVNVDDLNELEKLMPTRGVPSDIASALASLEIKDPFWTDTKAPAGRDILYLLPHKIAAIEYGGFAAHLFFNMTDKMKVTFGNIFNADNIDLKKATELVKMLLQNEDVSSDALYSLIPILSKISIQERKVGAMIQFGLVKGPFILQFNTSLQMGERNFWLSKKDQVATRLIFASLTGAPAAFSDKEGYRIKYGMGDTRIKLGLNTINRTDFQTDFGVEAIVPTSRFFFSPRFKTDASPTLDQKSLQDSFTTSLIGIRDYLVSPRLGNGGHFGLGCYLESKIGLFHNLMQLWTRASFDRLFENLEDRLIMFKRTMTYEDIHYGNDAEASQTAGDFIKQYILPSSFKCDVLPGNIYNFVTSLGFDVDKWRLALGYDFYMQQGERIKAIHNTSYDMQTLRIHDAESSSAQQHKVFTEALYIKKYKNSDLGFGLGGDTTFYSRGIGYDWTLYLKLGMSF